MITAALASLISVHAIADDAVNGGTDPKESNAAQLILLDNDAVSESSGLAFSNLSNDRLWTHNDSGDKARLFALDRNGKSTGGCELIGVEAIDFEDMASFVQDSVARMVVADVGDNRSMRPFVSLYFFDEPSPDQQTRVTDWTRIDVQYPDGPRDCESIAVDAQRNIVTLVSKSFLPIASVYQMPLPSRSVPEATETAAQTPPTKLTRVGTLPIPMATAADRDTASGDYVVINYLQLFRFPSGGADKSWWETTPTAVDLPRLKQIEAVAVDPEGNAWVTSEGSPMPLAKVLRSQRSIEKK
jgi:hypothetical protein